VNARSIESAAALIVLAAWVFAAHAIPELPARVPTHFGLSGTADATGPASSLWLLPAAITAMYVFLSALQVVPARFMNYPVKITDRNREAVYALGRALLTAVKGCTLLVLLAVEWGSIDAAGRGSLGPLFFAAMIAPVVLLLGVTAYYMLKMRAV
jgi:uncharacterized membrane protein